MGTPVGPPVEIDLFRIRCAVAALVVCVAHGGLLTDAGLRRTEIAVRVLSHVQVSPSSSIRRAVDRLISPADDRDGIRTIEAIAELAALTHVDHRSAPALAAALCTTLPALRQGALFDLAADEGAPDPAATPPDTTPRTMDDENLGHAGAAAVATAGQGSGVGR